MVKCPLKVGLCSALQAEVDEFYEVESTIQAGQFLLVGGVAQ